MIRFNPYPITINGSQVDELVRRTADSAAAAGLITTDQKLNALRNANRFDYIANPSPVAHHYETRVFALLSTIIRTDMGRCLLNSLMGGLPIWIIPYDTKQREVFGYCNSNTGHAVPEYTNGAAVRIAFSPDIWAFSQCGQYPGMRADEVLFHEMVHAYRYASYAIPTLNNDPLPDNQDHEEFLANQLTNVYRSMKGARKFNRDYMTKQLASAAECEKALWQRKELLDGLDYFLKFDPMVAASAKLKTEYNPFANIARLKAARLASMPGGITSIHAGRGMARPMN